MCGGLKKGGDCRGGGAAFLTFSCFPRIFQGVSCEAEKVSEVEIPLSLGAGLGWALRWAGRAWQEPVEKRNLPTVCSHF